MVLPMRNMCSHFKGKMCQNIQWSIQNFESIFSTGEAIQFQIRNCRVRTMSYISHTPFTLMHAQNERGAA